MSPKEVYGFKCMKCFSNVYVEYYTFRQYNGRIPTADSDKLKRSDVCKCGNCGLIMDLDGIVHLYCDDISTLMLCRVETSNPTDAEILQNHKGFYYQDYYEISSTLPKFELTKGKLKELSKVPNTRLQKSLKKKRKRDEKSKTRD